MRLFIDTNILLSAILFSDGVASRFLKSALDSHVILVGTYVINKLRSVFDRKVPDRVSELERFLSEVPFEVIADPSDSDQTEGVGLRDPKDEPVVSAALLGHADVLLSGDKDILEFNGEIDVEIMTVPDFATEHGIDFLDSP